MKPQKLVKLGLSAGLIMTLAACSKGGSGATSATGTQIPNFRLSLTDAPNGNFQSVNINLDSVELLMDNGKKSAVVPLTSGSGTIDLLSLQNGVTLNCGDLHIPKGVQVTGVRIHLKGDGHHAKRRDGSTCAMPLSDSAKANGFVIKFDHPFKVDDDSDHHNLVVDFDALKSLVDDDPKSCSCKFNPSITLKGASKWRPEHEHDDDFDKRGAALNNMMLVRDPKQGFHEACGEDEKRGNRRDDDDDFKVPDKTKVGQLCPGAVVPPVTPPVVNPPPIVVTQPSSPPIVVPTPTSDPNAPVVVPPTSVPDFFSAA